MERRPISELISEADRRLRDAQTRIEEVQETIARGRTIGVDLGESMKLLENLRAIAGLRARRLRYLRELAALKMQREETEL